MSCPCSVTGSDRITHAMCTHASEREVLGLLVKHMHVHLRTPQIRTQTKFFPFPMWPVCGCASAHCSTLWHGKHVNDPHGVVVHKLPQHQAHHLHGHTSTAVLQHLCVCVCVCVCACVVCVCVYEGKGINVVSNQLLLITQYAVSAPCGPV